MTRRQALGWGAAAAASGFLTGCDPESSSPSSPSPATPGTGGVTPSRTTPPTTSAPPTNPAFFGQPSAGNLYFGASVPHYRSLPAFEAKLGERLALNRSYFEPTDARGLVVRAKTDLRMRRLPHVSIKPLGTWEDIAAGLRDDWLLSMVEGLAKETGPVFLTINHEPENDAGSTGMTARDFVAMQQRAIRFAREAAPNVTIVPVLAYWTFNPRRADAAPEAWMVDEAAVFGLDVYNPWALSNGKAWHSLGSRMDEVAPWIGSKPVAIAEYGCRVDPLEPQRTAEWLKDAVDYARTHNVVSMSYFNSRMNSPQGSWELAGPAERAFARLLKQPWVTRPA
jgi:hypothetical protein